MQTNPSFPAPANPPSKPSLRTPMIVLGVLIAAFFLEVKWMGSRAAASILIFHQTENGWQQLPAPTGYSESLGVSSKGNVWVVTLGGAHVSRWDGVAWRDAEGAACGQAHYIVKTFALDGEQVWVPTREGVLHWDGQRWRCYREAAAGYDASIVAGGGEAWVLDSTGKLSHFERGQWHSQKLALPGVNWNDIMSTKGPKLARTSDGAVWLAWQGIWRFDGVNWAAVTAAGDSLKDAELIGAAGDRLWLATPSAIRSVSMDGNHWTVYPPTQTGLDKPHKVQGVAPDGSRTLFATTKGLLEFDGSRWRVDPVASDRVGAVRQVAAGPDGALWVMGYPPLRSMGAFEYLAIVTSLTPLAIVGVIIWIFWRRRRSRLQQHQLVTQAVQHATGEVPDELRTGERRLTWHGGIATTILIVGTGAGYVLLRHFWPQAPVWTILVLAGAIELAITFQQSLVKRTPKPSDPIGPGAPSGYDWGKTWKTLAGAVFVLLIFYLDHFPMLKFLRGYWFWMLVLVPIGYRALEQYLLHGAARRGDYDGALKIIRWFYFYNPSGMEPLRMSGHELLLAGRYREAEYTLRRSLASSQASDSYGFALEYLGDALMEQGRYDEAMRTYQAALHAFSWFRRPYRGMAEMLLRQGKNAQQALEHVEKIIDFSGISWLERNKNGKPQDDYWALKAWALARLGRSSEVEQAIENALKATDKKCLPDLATTHYRAGMAMQAFGNGSKADEHFQRAINLDPNGRRGALAKEALHEGRLPEALRA
jgi:tetratricopeptide (TPR) repeat protein